MRSKPAFKEIRALNFIDALRYIQSVSGDNSYYDRFWDYVSEQCNFHNDSTVEYYFTPEDESEENPQKYADEQLFRESFEIEKGSVQLEISW